jgi:hypothetical protein
VIQALLVTAKLNGLDPAAWLKDTLEKLPTWPNSRIDELLHFPSVDLHKAGIWCRWGDWTVTFCRFFDSTNESRTCECTRRLRKIRSRSFVSLLYHFGDSAFGWLVNTPVVRVVPWW